MRKYVTFVSKKGTPITMTKGYTTDDEYFEIMDNVDPEVWEVKFDTVMQ